MNFLGGLVGPYGGTKESEVYRPLQLAVVAVSIVGIMLLLLGLLLLLIGEFAGPVLLICASLHKTKKRYPGKEIPEVERQAVDVLYYLAIGLTLFTIYIGGFPIRYAHEAGRLWVVAWFGSFSLPLWVETYRLLIVLLLSTTVLILTVLEARVITEILFPSLPNSVRAKPGILSRIFPFMQIMNRESDEEEDDYNDDYIPSAIDSAPRRK